MTVSNTHRYLPRDALVSIVNAGFGGAHRKAGVELAPLTMFEAGLREQIVNSGRRLTNQVPYPDYTSLKPSKDASYRGMNNPRWVSAVTRSISNQVYEEARTKIQVLTVGGDHSIAIGTLTGIAKAVRDRFGSGQKLGIIYVDAHADLNVPEESGSGNIHGMALAFASGTAASREPEIFDWIAKENLVGLENLVYIGLRDVDESEKRTILNQKIRAFWMSDVKDLGIREVIRRCLEYLGDVPIHISFDIDALDPSVAPCRGLPVPDGLSLSQSVCIMEEVRHSGRLIAMDVVELNPSIGNNDEVQKTILAAFDLVKAGLADDKLATNTGSDRKIPADPELVAKETHGLQ